MSEIDESRANDKVVISTKELNELINSEKLKREKIKAQEEQHKKAVFDKIAEDERQLDEKATDSEKLNVYQEITPIKK